MKTINKYIILTIIVLMSFSCTSRLRVKVSAANRDLVIKKVEEDLKDQLPTVLENAKFDYEKGQILNETYFKFIKKYVIGYEKEIQETNRIFNDMEGRIKIADTLFNDGDNLGALNQANLVQNKLLVFYKKVDKFLKDDTVSSLDKLKVMEKDKDSDEKDLADLKSKISDLTELYESVSEIKESVSSKTDATNRLRFHLLGDPLTSYVTNDSLRKKIWKSTYNQTKVSTFMGDTDIAVLLRKNPEKNSSKSGDYNNNFTIKGVRLDAEDVIEASFKTLSQSINLFASIQLSGTNLTSNNSDTDFAQLPNSVNTALQNLNTNQTKLDEKQRYLQEVKNMLLEKIMLEDINGKRGDDVNESLDEINAFWTKLKAQLETVKSS